MNSLSTYSITFPSYFSCLLFFSSSQALSLFYYSLYYPSIVWLFLWSYMLGTSLSSFLFLFFFLTASQCASPLNYSCTTKAGVQLPRVTGIGLGLAGSWTIIKSQSLGRPNYNVILSDSEARIHRMVCCLPLTVHDFPTLQRPLISNYK